MSEEQIREILTAIRKVKVAVYGDFCLDAYWMMDPRGSEISLETGLKAEAVHRHYYNPGGASNITANLAALQPATIRAIGAIGRDIFGRELLDQLAGMGIDTRSLVIQPEDFNTYTFTKRYLYDEEQPRIDFGFYNKRSRATDEFILEQIRDALVTSDALIFNQQVPGSITNGDFIESVNMLFDEFHEKIVLLDSRHYNDHFRNIFRKTNDIEIARLNGITIGSGTYLPMDRIAEYGAATYRQFRKPVFVTCGERGIMVFDDQGIHRIRGRQFLCRLDTVGAGDTIMSALALCLAAGIRPAEAAEFANLAAAVTIRKLFITGTASGDEILSLAGHDDFIYEPDLAAEPTRARYIPGTQVEICRAEKPAGRIKHVVFDHDGTISTLRSGWEKIMEGVMMKAITGKKSEQETGRSFGRIHERVLDYIEKSTGVQTIVQMEALTEMVREFGINPEGLKLSAADHKRMYNEALLMNIKSRLEDIRKNPALTARYSIPGSIAFLKRLYKLGYILYLASGTDHDYLVQEAGWMGYAGFFKGGIFGAMDNISTSSKKMVIEKIIREYDLQGEELAVFGDGPVEIRECRKRNGLAVGVASDEVIPSRLNQAKRSRLIKAGADLIIPDYLHPDILLGFLK
jgi:bifunctional ADP-heptose synthase (sugar kinase/adenylyltransferase)/phosphoglycolate phosphatase-like HAD superfamily hydrolase